MQYKFVKIKGHDNWFLVLEKNTVIDEQINLVMQERMFRKVAGGIHNPKEPDWSSRVAMIAAREIDYEKILSLGDLSILVRPFGSYMFLTKDVKILKTVYDDDFPIDKYADIVVCENDEDTSSRFIRYLSKRFPGKSIEVISFFDTQSDDRIKDYFRHATYVTFTTTFTSFDWWHKLISNLQRTNKVIGHCLDKKRWSEALRYYKDVEVVSTKL